MTRTYIVKHCKNTGPKPSRTMPDNGWRATNELHFQHLQDISQPHSQHDSSSIDDGRDDAAPEPAKTAQEMWRELGQSKTEEHGQAKETKEESSSSLSSDGSGGDALSSDADDNASSFSFDSLYDVTPPKSPRFSATRSTDSMSGAEQQDVSPSASDSGSSSDDSFSSGSSIDGTPPRSLEPQAPSIDQNALGAWRRVMTTSLGGGEYVFDQEAYGLAQESFWGIAATSQHHSPTSSPSSDDSDCDSSANGSSKPSSPVLVLLAQDGCGCKGDPLLHFSDEKPPKDQAVGVLDRYFGIDQPATSPLRIYLPASHDAVDSGLGTACLDVASVIWNPPLILSCRPYRVTNGRSAWDPSFPRRNAVSQASTGDSDFVVACNTAFPSEVRSHSTHDHQSTTAPNGEIKDPDPKDQLPDWVLNVDAALPKPPSPVSCMMFLNRQDGVRDKRIERIAGLKRTDSFEGPEVALAKFVRETERVRRQTETAVFMRNHQDYVYLDEIALDVFIYGTGADGNIAVGEEDPEPVDLASDHERPTPVNEHHIPEWVLDVNAPLPNTPVPVICMGATMPDITYFDIREQRTRMHFKDLFDHLRVLEAERNRNALREWQQTFQRQLDFEDLQFSKQLEFFFSWVEDFGDLPAITDDVLSYDVGDVDGDTGSALGAIEALRLMHAALKPSKHLVTNNPVMVAGRRGKQKRGRNVKGRQGGSQSIRGLDDDDENTDSCLPVLPSSPTPTWARDVTAPLPMSTSPTTCMISHSGMPNLSFRTINAKDKTIFVEKTPESFQEIRDRERRMNIERKREERKETRKWFRTLQKRQAKALPDVESVDDAASVALVEDGEASQSSC